MAAAAKTKRLPSAFVLRIMADGFLQHGHEETEATLREGFALARELATEADAAQPADEDPTHNVWGILLSGGFL